MIGSETNTGIFTTTYHENKWKILIIMHNDATKPLEMSLTFNSDKEAQDFMKSNEPHITFATNSAFKIVHELGRFE